MKAMTVTAFGGIDRLELQNRPAPRPAAGEVTIAVSYAGVGFVDTLLRAGRFPFARPPFVPGIEVSGRVAELGDGVTGLAPGQRVAGLLTDFTDGGMGGYAELARAKAALVVPLDDGVPLDIAAATVVNGATAFLAMDEIGAGSRVAVSGSSGGLGRCLLAAARTIGAANVVAVSGSPSRSDSLLRSGATQVAAPDGIADLPDLDAAFDMVGGDVRLALLRRLRPGGRLVILGNASGQDVPIFGDDIWLANVTVQGLATGGISHLASDRIADAARRAIAAAEVYPPAIEVLDLAEAGKAHQALENRTAGGKIVLKVK